MLRTLCRVGIISDELHIQPNGRDRSNLITGFIARHEVLNLGALTKKDAGRMWDRDVRASVQQTILHGQSLALDIELTDVETHAHRRTHVPKLGAQVLRFNRRQAAEFRAVKDRPIAATSRHPNLVGVCTLAPRLVLFVSCLLLSRFYSAIDSASTHTHTLYTS